MSEQTTDPSVASDPDPDGEGGRDRTEGRNLQTDESKDGGKDQTQRPDTSGFLQEDDNNKGHFVVTFRIPHWLCACGTMVSVWFGLMAVLVVFIMSKPAPDTGEWMQEVQDRVGKAGVDVFRWYDLNRDGYLSIFEFEPLIPHLKNLSSTLDPVS